MSHEHQAKIKFLFGQYQAAIKDGIVEDVFRFGELYFNVLHGEITTEDKEQLQNDVLLCAAKSKNNDDRSNLIPQVE